MAPAASRPLGPQAVTGKRAHSRKQARKQARKPAETLAKRYRRARINMEEALAQGCTPAEAEERRARRQAHLEWLAGHHRLEALKNGRPLPPRHQPEPEEPLLPWWQKY